MASPLNCSRWTALGITALLITACGGGSASTVTPAKKATSTTSSKAKPTATPKAKSDTEQLNGMLAARAEALRSGDAGAFAATATGAQVAKDKTAIARAKALPINDVRMTAEGVEVDGERGTLRVDMIYSFEDLETQFLKTSRMSVRKTPEGWRVERDRPSAGALAPWEYTTYKARTSKHFLALAPKSLKVGKLMKDLEAGRARMMRGLPGINPPDRLLVIVARNGTDTKALTTDYHTLSALVAVAEARISFQGSARKVDGIGSQRVFVLWRSYGDRSEKERRMVIAHELTHAALVKRTGGRVPVWLTEGIAMYVSGDKRAGDAGAILSGAQLKKESKQDAVENVLTLGRLAKPDSMDNMTALPLAFAYSYSSAAAYTIADKHGGAKALLRLIKNYNSENIRGNPGKKLSAKVIKKTLHVSQSELDDEIRAYARSNSLY